jgi:hypothetical protein
MHNSLKIIKTLLYSYSTLHVSGNCAHHHEPPKSAHTTSSNRVSLGWLYLPALVCHYRHFRDSSDRLFVYGVNSTTVLGEIKERLSE